MYPASRVSFDLPRKIGKRKETLLMACTIPIEHVPNSNVTKPRATSLIIKSSNLTQKIEDLDCGSVRLEIDLILTFVIAHFMAFSKTLYESKAAAMFIDRL